MTDESPADRRKREKRERQEFIDSVNAAERDRRDKAREEKIWEDAVSENADTSFENDFKSMFGDWRADVEKDIRNAPNDAEKQVVLDALERARKAAKGGIFSSGDPAKAYRILKKNKGKIKKVRDKGKKGCIFVLVIGAILSSGILYGAYEGVTAIASAIF